MAGISSFANSPVGKVLTSAAVTAAAMSATDGKADDLQGVLPQATITAPTSTNNATQGDLFAPRPVGIRMSRQEIEAADLSNADKVIDFAIKNGFISEDSDVIRENLQSIKDGVRLARSDLYAPEILAKRLALLVEDGYISTKQAGDLMKSSNQEPLKVYHAVSYLRDLVRKLENFESEGLPESQRPKDHENHDRPITPGYIKISVQDLLGFIYRPVASASK